MTLVPLIVNRDDGGPLQTRQQMLERLMDERRHDKEVKMNIVTREVETRTVRSLSLEEVEQALRDQFDLHIQDDVSFEWDIRQGSFIDHVDIVHTERQTFKE